MRLAAFGVGVLTAALLLAGCGGSDSGESISKEEFIAKADAICKQSNQRMAAAFGKFLKDNPNLTKPNDPRLEPLVGKVMVPSLRREIEELKALGVPDGDGEKVGAIVSSLEEGLETAEDNPEVVTGSSSDTIFGIASRVAGEYGLKVCGSR
ncbi:MAG TPA: hypothetical protein VG898_09120 [Solirubrobacterales bacterium]|nr:hypothetical protein [Solirubrobacterales bacterium]